MNLNAPSSSSRVLDIERVFAAPPERVFAAFADYEAMAMWFGPGPCHVTDGEIDFTVGGRYRLRLETDGHGPIEVTGIYQTIERPTRLVFSWQWQGNPAFAPAPSVVSLAFQAHPEGCLLHLRQVGIDDAEVRADHRAGWNGTFDKLAHRFTGGSHFH